MRKWRRVVSVLLMTVLLLAVMSCRVTAAHIDKKFADLDLDAWYADSVAYVLSNKYMIGVSEDRFDPCGTVTKAQGVQILYNMDRKCNDGQINEPLPSLNFFADVSSENWYFASSSWAWQSNILSTDDSYFEPYEVLTREKLVNLFYQYHRSKRGESTADSSASILYSDWQSISPNCADGMSWAVRFGLITGTSKKTLSPKSSVTRAQLACMICNYLCAKKEPSLSCQGSDTEAVDGVLSSIEQEAFVLINRERAKCGLPAFLWNSDLQRIAETRAREVGGELY